MSSGPVEGGARVVPCRTGSISVGQAHDKEHGADYCSGSITGKQAAGVLFKLWRSGSLLDRLEITARRARSVSDNAKVGDTTMVYLKICIKNI